MSIIYDALKKVESQQAAAQPQAQQAKPDKPRKSRRTLYLALALIAAAGLFAVTRNQRTPPKTAVDGPFASNGMMSISSPEELPLTEPGPEYLSPDSFVLNGIFSSAEGNYALVNNRIVKTGDKLATATVKDITMDGVDLELDGSVIKLLNTAK